MRVRSPTNNCVPAKSPYMPKRAEPLTPSAVANAKPQSTSYKMTDGRGLFLLVTPDGGKLWRWRYRRPGKGAENMLSLGAYPEVSLKRAREKREEARTLLADGVDPSVRRKAERGARKDTFAAVAREWMLHTENTRSANTNRTIR